MDEAWGFLSLLPQWDRHGSWHRSNVQVLFYFLGNLSLAKISPKAWYYAQNISHHKFVGSLQRDISQIIFAFKVVEF